jgi:trehalose 6-phosphate phosphatase
LGEHIVITTIGSLPDGLASIDELRRRMSGRRLAVFLDYDGTLTPIVDRPQDAVISDGMREVVARLAQRCTVCVVSGRDRPVVQELMGLNGLVVAGSHGFDIWSPDGGIQRDEGAQFAELLRAVRSELETAAREIDGALVEPKAASVALHYRLVPVQDRPRAEEAVDQVLDRHPGRLKVTPGKMVYEVQPAFDWDKGKAVLYLLDALHLGADVLPMYLGDDFTDEHAFSALRGRGIGLVVSPGDDLADAARPTAADYRLDGVDDVQQFLDLLAR